MLNYSLLLLHTEIAFEGTRPGIVRETKLIITSRERRVN